MKWGGGGGESAIPCDTRKMGCDRDSDTLKFGGSQKGGFQKGGFGGYSPVPKPGTRVQSDVPRYQKPERGHIRQNRPFTKPPFCFLSNSATVGVERLGH